MIAFEHVSFAYSGQRPIFVDFDWVVAQREAWAVIGPSGCGKSTLLYLTAGLRQPQAGRVTVSGHEAPRPRASTGLVLQDYGLLPWATVRENVGLALRMGRFYRAKPGPAEGPRPYPRPDISPGQVDHWLERLGIAAVAEKYPQQISGGQRQRAAIARSLLQQPDLLLLDEPFSSLDALTREDLQRLVITLRQETGLTTVIVTHSIEEAVFLGERILVLDHPPNRVARVVVNPVAGSTRDQAAFTARCATLRTMLGERSGDAPT